MSNPSMIMVEAGGVDKGPAVEAAAEPPEVAPAGSEEELSTSQGLLLVELPTSHGLLAVELGSSSGGQPSS